MITATLSASSAAIEAAASALNTVPKFLENIGTRVTNPRAQAIVAGVTICAYGAAIIAVAGYAAAPFVTRHAGSAYDWARSLVVREDSVPAELVADAAQIDDMPQTA
jgi:hypothetical protein